MMSEAPELKPCPFCGGKARIGRTPCYDEYGSFTYIVCKSCNAKSREHYYSHGNDCPVLYATVRDEWNTRQDNASDHIEELTGGKDEDV